MEPEKEQGGDDSFAGVGEELTVTEAAKLSRAEVGSEASQAAIRPTMKV